MADELPPADQVLERAAWWFPLWEFAVHMFVGTAIFAMVYAPTVGLSLAVDWMGEKKINPRIVLVVECAEYALIVADSTMFLAFLVKTTWRGIKKL
jgi:hypothetical protein